MSQSFEAFGKYILLEKLATGGMAEVYLGKNNGAGGIGKLVAIKRILPQYSENPEFIDMFKDEAKIAVNLAHSNIVSIHEFGVEREQFFLVMDYVEGRNLRQILNKMKKSGLSFSVEQVLYIIKEVAAGLDSAHRCLDRSSGKPLNITHRDMSPQNVMISFEGEVKVVDFGIAKAETQIETTRAGTLKGKFGYMSPEQAEGQVVDLRTDVFSLGIVLWELLANDRLFVANNEVNTLRKIRECQIPSLRKINPNIPAELERICNKSLARDRNLRYQTAAAFHRELSRFLNRQYPDFSPHDFSVFIKTLFAGDILDHRKKIVEYSRVDATGQRAPARATAPATMDTPPVPTQANKQAEATRTEYETPAPEEHTQQSNSNSYLDDYLGKHAPKPKKKETAPPAQTQAPAAVAAAPVVPEVLPKAEAKRPAPAKKGKVAAKKKDPEFEIDKLRVDNSDRGGALRLDNGVRESSFANSTATGYRYNGRGYGYTITNSRIETKVMAKVSPGAASFGLILIVAAAFYLWKPDMFGKLIGGPATGGPVLEESIHQASKSMVSVTVSSSPPSAEVWVDGVPQKDVTPTTIQLESDREYQISLKRDQFAEWKVRRKFLRSGEKISAKLFMSRVAFIDVIVEGNGEIWINNERKAIAGPLIGVQIAAGEDVLVRAYDPQTGAEAVERVRLGEGFKKMIKLYPKILPKTNYEAVAPSGRQLPRTRYPTQQFQPRRQ